MDERKKDATIRRELKDINYLNRLYRRLRPAEDPEEICRQIQGGTIIAAEAMAATLADTTLPRITYTDGINLYLRTADGKYMAVSLAALPAPQRLDIMTADIITR